MPLEKFNFIGYTVDRRFLSQSSDKGKIKKAQMEDTYRRGTIRINKKKPPLDEKTPFYVIVKRSFKIEEL